MTKNWYHTIEKLIFLSHIQLCNLIGRKFYFDFYIKKILIIIERPESEIF